MTSSPSFIPCCLRTVRELGLESLIRFRVLPRFLWLKDLAQIGYAPCSRAPDVPVSGASPVYDGPTDQDVHRDLLWCGYGVAGTPELLPNRVLGEWREITLNGHCQRVGSETGNWTRPRAASPSLPVPSRLVESRVFPSGDQARRFGERARGMSPVAKVGVLSYPSRATRDRHPRWPSVTTTPVILVSKKCTPSESSCPLKTSLPVDPSNRRAAGHRGVIEEGAVGIEDAGVRQMDRPVFGDDRRRTDVVALSIHNLRRIPWSRATVHPIIRRHFSAMHTHRAAWGQPRRLRPPDSSAGAGTPLHVLGGVRRESQ